MHSLVVIQYRFGLLHDARITRVLHYVHRGYKE
jgi:hypothetical protein